MKILVVGDSIQDVYEEYRTVRKSPEGEHSVVEFVRRWEQPGGAAAVSAMCSALGAEVVSVFQGEPHPIKRRVIVDGQVVFRHDKDTSGAFGALPEDSFDVVLISDYRKGLLDRDAIVQAMQLGRTIVDPGRNTTRALYSGAWAVCPNQDEDRAAHFCDYWGRCVLKLGAAGMLVKESGETISYPARQVDAVDVCGAGDQVLATLGVCTAAGMGWFEAARWANQAAGLKCGKRGATPVSASEMPLTFQKVFSKNRCRTRQEPTKVS